MTKLVAKDTTCTVMAQCKFIFFAISKIYSYIGQWKNDKQNGTGKEVWKNGSIYSGGFKDSMKHGKGEFKWSDGSSYTGDFENNDIQGQGKNQF